MVMVKSLGTSRVSMRRCNLRRRVRCCVALPRRQRRLTIDSSSTAHSNCLVIHIFTSCFASYSFAMSISTRLMMRPSRTARFLPRLNGMVDADRVRKRREPKLRRESKRSTCKIVLHTARAWELKQAGKQDKSSCPESNLVTRHMTVLLTCDLKRNIHLPTNVSFGDTCT
jgi:hypothetical protein